jgi:hypothetical protein
VSGVLVVRHIAWTTGSFWVVQVNCGLKPFVALGMVPFLKICPVGKGQLIKYVLGTIRKKYLLGSNHLMRLNHDVVPVSL